MKLEAPPSRYRVVERGGRLVVVDTVAGGVPPKARELVPAGLPDPPDHARNAAPYPRNPPTYPREGGDPEPQAIPPLTLDSRFRGNTGFAPEPPSLLRNVASTVCSDARDGDGRLQWTTARWFDARAPRTVTLTRQGEEQLGVATLALLIGAFCAVIFAVAMGVVGWVILVIAVTSLPRAKPVATAWIDRLERG